FVLSFLAWLQRGWRAGALACAALIALSPIASVAAAESEERFADKLTVGFYRFADTGDAVDVNLRRTGDYGNVWLGYYDPDQRHIHAVYRKSLPGNHRITIDVLHKIGLVDDVLIRRTGASVTYDWPRFFVRLAFDPKVNFTPENMWRVSVGTRF